MNPVIPRIQHATLSTSPVTTASGREQPTQIYTSLTDPSWDKPIGLTLYGDAMEFFAQIRMTPDEAARIAEHLAAYAIEAKAVRAGTKDFGEDF